MSLSLSKFICDLHVDCLIHGLSEKSALIMSKEFKRLSSTFEIKLESNEINFNFGVYVNESDSFNRIIHY